MRVDNHLKKLAKEIKAHKYSLYIVGGYVRDSILNLNPTDIDITSNMPYNEVKDICTNLNYKVKVVNKSLGTLLITTPSSQFEYTQFRKESYVDGNHTPSSVEFVDDIEIDSLRRDITINSIYYDISGKKIIDILDGQKDISKKIIRTSNSPEITLKDDGLRILRLIRFASVYNFKLEKNTYKALKRFSYNLKNISKERILNELNQICVADLKYKFNNSIGLTQLSKLNLFKYIFNSSFSKIRKLNKKEISSFYTLGKDSRIIGLYIILLKKLIKYFCPHKQLNFTINTMLGVDGIKESRENIQTTEKLYCIMQNLEYNVDTLNASINYLTLSNAEKDIINKLLSTKANTLLSDIIRWVKARNLPLGVHQLDITPKDLLDANIEDKYIGKLMGMLYNKVLEMKVKNLKEDLLALAKSLNELGLQYKNNSKE